MSILLRPAARTVATTFVLERERELAAIRDALSRAEAGAGTAVIVQGEAGIGKSTLARRAADEATGRGLRTLRAQGGVLEGSLPYGIVVELFGALVRNDPRLDELFAGPARLAAPLFGMSLDAEPATGQEADRADPVAYVHGLFWLVLNLVERGPLAIIVDDAQWADEPSLRFLHHLARRVEELPLVLVLAMRPDAGTSPSPAAGLLRADVDATHLAPEALSETAVGELLEDVAGQTVTDDLRRAAWHATGGNPFLVTELAADLRNAAGVAGASDLGSILPVGVGRYVDARLAAAEGEARALAEAVVVLGDSATLHRVAKLAMLESAAAAGAVRWLMEASILDDVTPLRFRHPLVRSAVDAAIPGPARAELHRRAALLLADEGIDIGVVGAQLREASATADPRVVELLEAAARDAVGRGEPKIAVTLLRRAIAEPPAADQRLDVLSKLARAEAAAGDVAAPETFGEALALVRDPDRRAGLRLELGHALVAGGQWAAALEAFARGLDESPDASEELRARLDAGYLSAAWVTMEDRIAIGDRVRRILAEDELGPANRELAAWIAFQQGAVVGSPAHEMGALVRRVFSEAPIETLAWEGQTIEVGVGLLLETGELPLEVDILTRAIHAARRTGPIGKAGVYSYCRAWPQYYMGRLTDAIADGEEAMRAAEFGWEAFVPAAASVTALAHIERDDLDAAERVLVLDPDRWAGRIDMAMLVPLAAGRLALARGDVSAGAELLRQACEGAGAAFMRNNVPTDWRTWYATALLRLDRRDEAREIAREGLEIARTWGAAWPLGASLRVAGLVEGGAEGIALLREGEALLKDSPAQLEHARLLVSFGATLRRHGSLIEAREVLSRAADLAHRIGARALLRRATSELHAAGARPRRIALTGVDALTPAELRVAQEALEGRTNREIAQALFVTPKAVEFHLANVYRKLGIASRTELAVALR